MIIPVFKKVCLAPAFGLQVLRVLQLLILVYLIFTSMKEVYHILLNFLVLFSVDVPVSF